MKPHNTPALPQRPKRGRPFKYGWHGMAVGDRFYARGRNLHQIRPAIQYAQKITGFVFIPTAAAKGTWVTRVA